MPIDFISNTPLYQKHHMKRPFCRISCLGWFRWIMMKSLSIDISQCLMYTCCIWQKVFLVSSWLVLKYKIWPDYKCEHMLWTYPEYCECFIGDKSLVGTNYRDRLYRFPTSNDLNISRSLVATSYCNRFCRFPPCASSGLTLADVYTIDSAGSLLVHLVV